MVVAAMEEAHRTLSSRVFRIRDDLLTPRTMAGLTSAIEELSWRPTWTARVRLGDEWTAAELARARRAGLSELWVGLESASARVRDLMDKGTSAQQVDRTLDAAAEAGLPTRLLCLLGYPGETHDEREQTLAFLEQRADPRAGVSLTMFQLTRRSALAASFAGLRRRPDPVPRHRRLRHDLPFAYEPPTSPADVERTYREGRARLALALGFPAGPFPSHGLFERG